MFELTKSIAIGSDHAGFEIKEHLKAFLLSEHYTVKDFGTFSEQRMDYPDVAHPLAHAVHLGNFACGILICGSGNGVAIVANKYAKVRAGICWNEEITSLARKHNDANIMVLPGRFVSKEESIQYLKKFISTPFEGERHEIRVEKILNIL